MAKKRKNVVQRDVAKVEDNHETLWRSSIVAAATSLPLWAPAIRGMHVVFPTDPESMGLNTMGVDPFWRCYVNVDFMFKLKEMAEAVSPDNPCKSCGKDYHHSIAYIGGVICHEASHLLRDHAVRAKNNDVHSAFLGYLWNVAADMEINDGLLEIFKGSTKVKGGLCLPPMQAASDKSKPEVLDSVLLPQVYGYDDGKLTEEYFYKLKEEPENKCPSCGGTGKVGEEKKEGDEEGDGGCGKSCEAGDGEGQDGQGQGKGEGEEGEGDGQGQGQGQGKEGHGQGQGHGAGGGKPCPCCKGTGVGRGEVSDCGSGADGLERAWDEGEPDDNDKPGLSEIEQRMIRKEVAKNIQDAVRNRGNLPGGWRRWADEQLGKPKYDWRKELRKILGRTMHTIPGDRYRSYKRLSRRCASLGHKVILPSHHDTTPQVCIIQDTSGSMGADNMRIALEETQGLLRAAQATVNYINCDASADKVQRVRDARDIDLYGGGGTDMRVGIKAALASHPSPDVMILFTDGWTPWPTTPPPRGKQLVVCLVGESACNANEVPSWARVVKIVEEVEDVRYAGNY